MGKNDSRKASVHTLRVLADKLMTHHNNVCIAQVVGSSISIAGFGVMALGFGLSFVTGGISITTLTIAGIGGVINIAGGLINTGAVIAETWIQKDTIDTAQKIINEDREASKAIKKLQEEFEREAWENLQRNGAKALRAFAKMLWVCAVTGYEVGVRVGLKAASEGGGALSEAKNASHIGVFASAPCLLHDIYTFATNWEEIDASRNGKKEKEPKAVKKLRELADELKEKNMPDENGSTCCIL